ncbi:MAG: hypothetical protein WC054_03185 [Candidatus Nanopelagicales bacterium]
MTSSDLLRDRVDQWRELHANEPGTAWMGLAGCTAARRSGDGLRLVRVTTDRLWVESALHPELVAGVPLWAVVDVEILRYSTRGEGPSGDVLHVLEPIEHGDRILVPSVLKTDVSARAPHVGDDHFLLADVDSPREFRELIAAHASGARERRIEELRSLSGGLRIPAQRPRRLASVSSLRAADGPDDPDGDGPDLVNPPAPDVDQTVELLTKLSG